MFTTPQSELRVTSALLWSEHHSTSSGDVNLLWDHIWYMPLVLLSTLSTCLSPLVAVHLLPLLHKPAIVVSVCVKSFQTLKNIERLQASVRQFCKSIL